MVGIVGTFYLTFNIVQPITRNTRALPRVSRGAFNAVVYVFVALCGSSDVLPGALGHRGGGTDVRRHRRADDVRHADEA